MSHAGRTRRIGRRPDLGKRSSLKKGKVGGSTPRLTTSEVGKCICLDHFLTTTPVFEGGRSQPLAAPSWLAISRAVTVNVCLVGWVLLKAERTAADFMP